MSRPSAACAAVRHLLRTLPLLLVLAALLFVGGCVSSNGNAPHKHEMIQFSDMSIHPSVAEIEAGGSAVWINLSDDYIGAVTFPDSIRSAFTCSQIRPDFMQISGRIQSIPIGPDNENVTLPCALKPGRYDYELWLSSRPSEIDNPQRRLKGTLVFK